MDPYLEQSLYSVFAQDEIALGPDWALIVGSKLEHNAYTGWEVEPNGRLRWNFSPNQMLWAAISRAVRTPSRLDRDLAEPAPPESLILGSSNFESETLIAYELGYRTQISPLASVSLSTFYNDYDRLRGLGLTPGTILPLVYGNDLEGKTFGAELAVDYQLLSWWRLHGGYDLLREHLWVKPGLTDFYNALDETEDPEQQFSVRSAMDLRRNLHFSADLRWVDTLIVDNGGVPATVPSYTEMDARLGWNLTRAVELSLVGQNLLHAQHPEYGPPGPTQEEIRRNIYGTVEYRY